MTPRRSLPPIGLAIVGTGRIGLITGGDPDAAAARGALGDSGARAFAELLGWYRYRVKDEYCLVGVMDGVLVGMVNGRSLSRKIGISLHTIAMRRGLRVGAHLFAAKMEYHIEYLNQQEVYIVAESPIGFRRWMIEYPLEKTNIPHELGGGDS